MNTKWLDAIETGTDCLLKEIDIFEENTSSISTTPSNNDNVENLKHIHCQTKHKHNSSHQQDNEQGCCTDKKAKLHSTGNCNCIPSHDTSNSLSNINEDENVRELDSDDEQDDDLNVIHHDTLLHDPQVTHVDPEICPSSLTYAPGEGCKPISIFQDKDVEYLAFPTIFLWATKKREEAQCPIQ